MYSTKRAMKNTLNESENELKEIEWKKDRLKIVNKWRIIRIFLANVICIFAVHLKQIYWIDVIRLEYCGSRSKRASRAKSR